MTPVTRSVGIAFLVCVAIGAGCRSRQADPDHTARGGVTAEHAGTSGHAGISGHGGSGTQAGGFGSGRGGASGSGQAGAPGLSLAEVARSLDGFTFRVPCHEERGVRFCSTRDARPCPKDSDPALTGTRPVDEEVKLGGDPETLYAVRLRVQGVVEGKDYVQGTDQSSEDALPADGFYVGGRPAGGNAYNVYMIRVTDPPQDYFLNSIATPSDGRIRHAVFPVDYGATLRVRGGASVRLVLSDANCHALKNCADLPEEQDCMPQSLPNLDPRIETKLQENAQASGPYDEQFLGLVVTEVVVAPE